MKLIPACRFPFNCGMVFTLNQSNHIEIGIKRLSTFFQHHQLLDHRYQCEKPKRISLVILNLEKSQNFVLFRGYFEGPRADLCFQGVGHESRDRKKSPVYWSKSETSKWYSLLILQFYWLNYSHRRSCNRDHGDKGRP